MADLRALCIDGECRNIPQADVTGVKGQQESSYRTGNVNLTPDNIIFLGVNPHGTLADDTRAKWRELGTGYAYISGAGQVHGQPSTNGLVISYRRGASLFQIWHGTNNTYYKRYGASGEGDMPEWTPVNTDTKYTAGDNLTLTNEEFALKSSPALKGAPTAPNISDKSTSTTQIANSAFVQGAINRRLPKTVISKRIDEFTIASGTYVYKDIYTAPAYGTLFITGEAQFSANASGYRLLGLQYVPSGGSANWLSRITNNPVTNGNTFCNAARVTDMSAGAKIRAVYWQGSGSSLTVSAHQWQGYFITD